MGSLDVVVDAKSVLGRFTKFHGALPRRREVLVSTLGDLMYQKVRGRLRYNIGALQEGLHVRHGKRESRVWVYAMQSRRQELLYMGGVRAIPPPHRFVHHHLRPDWEFGELVDAYGAMIPMDRPPWYRPDFKWLTGRGFFTDGFYEVVSSASRRDLLVNVIKDFVDG